KATMAKDITVKHNIPAHSTEETFGRTISSRDPVVTRAMDKKKIRAVDTAVEKGMQTAQNSPLPVISQLTCDEATARGTAAPVDTMTSQAPTAVAYPGDMNRSKDTVLRPKNATVKTTPAT